MAKKSSSQKDLLHLSHCVTHNANSHLCNEPCTGNPKLCLYLLLLVIGYPFLLLYLFAVHRMYFSKLTKILRPKNKEIVRHEDCQIFARVLIVRKIFDRLVQLSLKFVPKKSALYVEQRSFILCDEIVKYVGEIQLGCEINFSYRPLLYHYVLLTS